MASSERSFSWAAEWSGPGPAEAVSSSILALSPSAMAGCAAVAVNKPTRTPKQSSISFSAIT
eukprot:12223167-Alexandrium_andersonii.AAC.1